MRALERILSELHSRINIYRGIRQQSSQKVEAFRQYYERLHGDDYLNHINEDLEYLRAVEKMKLAEGMLESLEIEKKEILEKVKNFMR